MFFAFAVLAVGLAVASFRAREKGTKLLLGVFCFLNAFCAIHVVWKEDPYAFKLKPNDGYSEPDYRR